MGLKGEIWAWRLGGGWSEEEEVGGEGENPPCHRPIRGRCPKGPRIENSMVLY